jgi:hypothetical protein
MTKPKNATKTPPFSYEAASYANPPYGCLDADGIRWLLESERWSSEHDGGAARETDSFICSFVLSRVEHDRTILSNEEKGIPFASVSGEAASKEAREIGLTLQPRTCREALKRLSAGEGSPLVLLWKPPRGYSKLGSCYCPRYLFDRHSEGGITCDEPASSARGASEKKETATCGRHTPSAPGKSPPRANCEPSPAVDENRPAETSISKHSKGEPRLSLDLKTETPPYQSRAGCSEQPGGNESQGGVPIENYFNVIIDNISEKTGLVPHRMEVGDVFDTGSVMTREDFEKTQREEARPQSERLRSAGIPDGLAKRYEDEKPTGTVDPSQSAWVAGSRSQLMGIRYVDEATATGHTTRWVRAKTYCSECSEAQPSQLEQVHSGYEGCSVLVIDGMGEEPKIPSSARELAALITSRSDAGLVTVFTARTTGGEYVATLQRSLSKHREELLALKEALLKTCPLFVVA